MKELNSVKESVGALRSEVMCINNTIQATKAPSTCHIYVKHLVLLLTFHHFWAALYSMLPGLVQDFLGR